MTVALAEYRRDLEANGLRDGSIKTIIYRLRDLLDELVSLGDLTPIKGRALWDALRHRRQPDTQFGTLAAVKRFTTWAMERGYVRRDPFAGVRFEGRRRRGKPQLSIDEARKLVSKAIELAANGDRGALATLCALLLGMRAGEVAGLERRDIDDDGRLVRIRRAKTTAGERRLEVPEVLRPMLLAAGDGRLFGSRFWLAHHVDRLCRIADVSIVSPHGLRGTHATLAAEAGATGHLVAAALGHTSPRTAERHYIADGVPERQRQRRALSVIDGGRR